MSDFDPYHRWLGIPPKDQPPNHYRLLGLDLFEADLDVIEAAAEQRMLFVNQCATGPHIQHSQRLLNELSAARICLLNAKRKDAYDADLKLRLNTPTPPVKTDGKSPANPTPAIEKRTTEPNASRPTKPVAVPPQPLAIQVTPPIPTSLSKGRGKGFSPQPWQIAVATCSLVVCLGLGIWILWPQGKAKAVARNEKKKALSEDDTETSEKSAQVKAETDKSDAPKVTDDKAIDVKGSSAKVAQLQEPVIKEPEAETKKKLDSEPKPMKEPESATMEDPEPPEPNDGSPRRFDATEERPASAAQLAQEQWAKHLKTDVVIKNKDLIQEFVLIPPGKFKIGETDKKLITLTKPFWVSRTEITQLQWEKVMKTAPWAKKNPPVKEDPDYAATYISWKDAREFCQMLSARDGFRYRLLTEAEWEYACRAGTQTAFSYGDDESKLGQYGRYQESIGPKDERSWLAVRKFKPNPFGLFDMHGNTWEWCQDRHTTELPSGTNPLVTSSSGPDMVVRGGGWKDAADSCTSDTRSGVDCKTKNTYIGFRIMREVEKPEFAGAPQKLSGPSLAVFDATVERSSEDAHAAQKELADRLKTEVDEINSIDMTLVLLPPGKFKMSGGTTAATPIEVTLTRPIRVSATEVTQNQWWNVMQTMPWSKDGVQNGNDSVATFVSWEDAQEFCRELSVIEGARYRLLTEAEWEYACRAGTLTQFSFGEDEAQLKDHAWFLGNTPSPKEKDAYIPRVGLKQPNPFNLFDMHGNVAEWCEDFYNVKLPGGENPIQPKLSNNRVSRGGSWRSETASCSSAFRGQNSPKVRLNSLGFRVAREILEK
ncbi:MAG: hypothetical protein JWM11_2688 [Planctomycetaceae bacterium]|nr:hypothetical protein [Planctomycetaceae bacterium]